MQKLTAEKCRPVVGDSKLSVSSVLCGQKSENFLQIKVSSGPIMGHDPDLWDKWRQARRSFSSNEGYFLCKPMPSVSKVRRMFQRIQESFVGSIAAKLSTLPSAARFTEVPDGVAVQLQPSRLGLATCRRFNVAHGQQQHDALISPTPQLICILDLAGYMPRIGAARLHSILYA